MLFYEAAVNLATAYLKLKKWSQIDLQNYI